MCMISRAVVMAVSLKARDLDGKPDPPRLVLLTASVDSADRVRMPGTRASPGLFKGPRAVDVPATAEPGDA
ncbi:hypothetical protein SSP35_14_01310 [Streptomyces sp. NBRC 110611]|nr:hypothetical protein SSP35_14_01310 [Streptomyces sp. NBRC 110611]